MTAYLQLERRGGRWRLGAALADADVRTWDLGTGDAPAVGHAAGEMATYIAGADAVVTYSASPLADWLSAPSVLRQARTVLDRLIDACEVALLVVPGLRDFSLEAFCGAHRIDPPSTEDADSFLQRWETLCLRLRERGRALPKEVRSLVASIAGDAWPAAVLGDAPEAPGAGRVIAAMLPRRPRRARPAAIEPPADLQDAAADALLPDGPVAATHPTYEHRPGQIEMARAVAAAFEREEFLLVEAGTGTGKSLAYLIPAIALARGEGVPVVVSTNTKNLQDQLVQRDIPLAGRAVGIEFTAQLVKGRNNYVCPRLLAAVAESTRESVFRDDRLALAHIVAWASRAAIADLDSLSPDAFDIAPALRSAVSQVRARSDACAGRRCAYFQSCPVEVVRAHAQNADLVVVNHALLLAAAGTTVLPEHEHIVIDEAHNLEDVATDQLGREVTDASVRRLLRMLAGEGVEPVDQRVAEWLASVEIPDDALIHEARTALPERIAQLEYSLEDLAAAILNFVERAPSPDRGGSDRASIRLTSDVRAIEGWQAVVAELPAIRQAMEGIRAVLAAFADGLAASGEEPDDASAAILLDIEQLQNLLADLGETLAIIMEGEADGEYVCWVATWMTRRGDPGWGLRAAPIDVGPALQEAMYGDASTVVMTSATLTVEDSFDYVRQRLGLDAERDRLLELVVPSPFDFPNQLLMCIPGDLPVPTHPEFNDASQQAILNAALAAGGGTLCLFTSRESMTKAFERLHAQLEEASLTPICQDLTISRTAALEALRDDPTVVLFGVKSFWEGIDVPGEALRCLVMVKLPFAVPSDPIIQARQERVEEQGLNGYDAYYVPNAVIGFRQGIGRLIRTKRDRGAVFVLDRRVLLRRYGARFMQSIPACRVSRGPLDDCVSAARDMLTG